MQYNHAGQYIDKASVVVQHNNKSHTVRYIQSVHMTTPTLPCSRVHNISSRCTLYMQYSGTAHEVTTSTTHYDMKIKAHRGLEAPFCKVHGQHACTPGPGHSRGACLLGLLWPHAFSLEGGGCTVTHSHQYCHKLTTSTVTNSRHCCHKLTPVLSRLEMGNHVSL